MTDEKLLPCPFCGGTVIVSLHGDKRDGYWWSINRGLDKKTKCTCRLFLESDKFDFFSKERKEEEQQALITKWNTRATTKSLPVERNEYFYGENYYCPFCGESVQSGDNFCRKCGQKIDWGEAK